MDKMYIMESIGADASSGKDKLLVRALQYIAETDNETVVKWLETFKGLSRYNNYLTEKEATDIVSKFKNANGTSGPTWSFQEIKSACDRMGLKLDDAPYFNEYAMYVAINMFVSDQYKTLLKWIGNSENKMFEMCYDLAYSQLKDADRPNWIRSYFEV